MKKQRRRTKKAIDLACNEDAVVDIVCLYMSGRSDEERENKGKKEVISMGKL